ncbi:MAG: hypothetical protein KAT68_08240 [Bacteroidales bacterium]|nr:hypothetical protein [Bacteroidales bacterium]
MNNTTKKNIFPPILKRYHNRYFESGLYNYVWRNTIIIILIIIVIILLFAIIEKYIIDIDYLFLSIFKSNKPKNIFIYFFMSESLLGLIPPDFFILWTKQFPQPYNAITILALLSYIGGIISYFIGIMISSIPKIKIYIELRLVKKFNLIRKWGGIFILISALFPLPYSTVSMIAGIVHYKFGKFIIIGLARILRFYIYAFILFEIIKKV